MISRRSLAASLCATGIGAGALTAARGVAASGRDSMAVEFTGIEGWLNADAPLTIAGLRGMVTLVDFWTYSCINCRRTVPYLNRWQAEYGVVGLRVVGIHTPEFGFERMRPNVEAAVREFGIRFPVGQDNRYETWRAWRNRAWPTFYLLDQEGRIVLAREGEGYAWEIEGAIRGLLGLTCSDTVRHPGDDPDLSRIRSPEMYFGSMHPTPQDSAQSPRRGEAAYAFGREAPRLNSYQLDGTWARGDEALVLRSSGGRVRVRFSAAKLHLVAGASEDVALTVRVDGGPPQTVAINRPTLYTLLDGQTYGEHLIEFESDRAGLSLFSATFG